ncbi:hypothetical protein FDI29_gp48 [Arthrobacter phage Abidatro]|uniref:Uncharacterized protein n=1 Tax=Arthrobacter phage Abidatro TaxID=2015853 RepID=A0A222ZFK9_9CAUD|nr:hypothetical protein FDI29_gp48 [Arthrobacter phage Abidatro]ASR83218.1 hypothetical protein SEA_ABIDATRO_48 [Arthrobacter phage Abidatro]
MVDVKQEWRDGEVQRLASHVARTAARLEELAERYVSLVGHIPAGSNPGGRPAGRAADEPGARGPAGPRVPLRLDVVDVREEVALFVRDLLPRVRIATSAGVVGPSRSVLAGAGNVVPGLLFMALALPGVFAADRGLGDEVARGAWDLVRRAALAAGEVPRPFALTDLCESCGVRSLWVVPERMVIRCGNPGCGWSEPVAGVSAPAYSSADGQ